MVRSVGEAFAEVSAALKKAGISGYDLEARELTAHAFGMHRDFIRLEPGRMVGDNALEKLSACLEERLSGKPLQYILGNWDFYGLEFDVTSDTLIPRSDTEVLVEYALELLKGKTSGKILDLGCGTGCIGISILKNLPASFSCTFADISPAALGVTKKNILRHGLLRRSGTVIMDMRESFPGDICGFDMILSNPPYLTLQDMNELQEEVKYEPKLALFGGDDGLDFYRAIAKNAFDALVPGGYLLCEIGMDQHDDVREIFASAGFAKICLKKDLSGIFRVVKAEKL